jgi:hypothetical protein
VFSLLLYKCDTGLYRITKRRTTLLGQKDKAMQATWDLVITNEDKNNWYTNCVGGCGHQFASAKVIGVPVGNVFDNVIEYIAGTPKAKMCMDCHLTNK